jgi:hypothetical protein
VQRLLFIFLNTSLLLYCCGNTTGKSGNTGTIRFEFIGESDKPMPKMVLYSNGEFDTGRLGSFEEAFELDQQEFSKIEDLIEARFANKLPQLNYFQFTLSDKDKNRKLYSSDKTVTRGLLKDIAGVLEKNQKNKTAENYIYGVIRRI